MGPKILAHRTAMAEAPENSLEGFKKCFSNAVDAVECDISFTKNGKAIVCTKAIDYNEDVLTINDIWEFISDFPQIKIFFDIKFSRYLTDDLSPHFIKIPPKVIELVKKEIIQPAKERKICHRIGLVGFWGCFDLLKVAKEMEPTISTSLIIILPWLGKFPWNSLNDYFSFLDTVIIGWKKFNQWKVVPWSLVLDNIITVSKKAGKNVEGGVVNTEEEILWALKNNFYGIWTDNTTMVKNFFERRKT